VHPDPPRTVRGQEEGAMTKIKIKIRPLDKLEATRITNPYINR
jgi:hypothetical protein